MRIWRKQLHDYDGVVWQDGVAVNLDENLKPISAQQQTQEETVEIVDELDELEQELQQLDDNS